MSFTMGETPEEMTVVLNANADFNCTLTNTAENWAATAYAELRWPNGTVWTTSAPVTNTMTFAITDTLVDAQIVARPRRAQLYYLDSGSTTPPIYWAVGAVEINA